MLYSPFMCSHNCVGGAPKILQLSSSDSSDIPLGNITLVLYPASIFYFGAIRNNKRCHYSFPVFLKKPVSVHNLRRNNVYKANTILFGYSTLRGEHSYIGFEKYLMLGRENGAKTCLRTTTTRIMNTVRALTFEETIVI